MSEGKHQIIYPAYINKNRTVADGRRIALQHAVADPKPNELTDALAALKGFKTQIEYKPYCRETNKEMVPWRVKYQNDPSKNSLTNKRAVLVACSRRISEVRAKSGPVTVAESSGQKKKKK